jgi:hypothetical protein
MILTVCLTKLNYSYKDKMMQLKMNDQAVAFLYMGIIHKEIDKDGGSYLQLSNG